jgi:ankyrin repeat protein
MLDDGDRIDPELCQYIVEQTLNLDPNDNSHRKRRRRGWTSNQSNSSDDINVPPMGGILTRNKHGKTPLSLLVQHIDDDMVEITNRNKLWSVLRETFLPVLMSNATITRGLELHTLVDHRCLHSKGMMETAVKVYSHQASMRDALGRTPLHVAVADTGSCRCSYEALQSLIEANPKAPRMGDNDGRLPIDWAAECPHVSSRNLALLMKGEPRAIDTRDLHSRRYPFLAAAMKEHNNSINNTYALLRAKPHVISYFHTP